MNNLLISPSVLKFVCHALYISGLAADGTEKGNNCPGGGK